MGDFVKMNGTVGLLLEMLEIFLNVLEFIAIVISVTTVLFLMFNKFSKGLKVVLGPCGFPLRARLRVLFICRSSFVKKRAFLEFAMLETGGYGTIPVEWHTIVNKFKSFYAANEQNLVYEIPNCTALIGSDFSAVVARYFEFLGKADVRRAFGIQDDALEWVTRIHIEEAYTTPTCLLTGLLSQYEESWEEFIKRYVSTAYITESAEDAATAILPNELYFTFAWLLWGPSYELEYRNYWAGLCQMSYGDESNSIPVVANYNTEVIHQLRDKLTENYERRYGALVSAELSIYEKKAYYKRLRNLTNPENAYFYDKVENGEFSFAAQIDSFVPSTNYKAKKYYCTAYVWLLFELEDEISPAFHPERSVAFFEHANLTDKNTYQFLIETLIEKALKHFERILLDPKYDGRKYRFVCALNNRIANDCKKRFAEIAAEDTPLGRAIASRIILEEKRPAATVFAAFDEFFSPNEDMTYEEIDLKDPKAISDLARFYAEIYLNCFPNPDERESFDNLLSYLREGEGKSEYRYRILLVKDSEDRILGGSIFDYFKRSNSGIIEFIAVKNDLQSGGIGSNIYQHVLALFNQDAIASGKTGIGHVFCEIDSPEYSTAAIKKYLYFWNKNHYRHIDFSYVQPALSASQAPVEGLWLTVAKFADKEETLDSALLLDVVYDYMKYCMHIEDPAADPSYIKMKKEVEAKGAVALLPII